MKVIITGATGFVGQKLVAKLLIEGHDVYAASRSKEKASQLLPENTNIVEWNYDQQAFPKDIMDQMDAVVHLMGENISAKRWSNAQKKRIHESRVISTEKIVAAINGRPNKLKFFFSTSAIGIYPANKLMNLTEKSAISQEGFLSDVCKAWEEQALKTENVERKVIGRFGVVLGREDGAVAKLYPIFRIGGGGPIGLGNAFMSWIHVDDVVKIISDAISNKEYEGTINVVAPSPTTNKEFTKAFARALGVPALFPVPPLALKVVFGEMSKIILDSQKVIPEFLNKIHHEFLFPSINAAFQDICSNINVENEDFKAVEKFEAYQFIPKKKEEVFEFFTDPYNLGKITPDFLNFKIKSIDTLKVQEGSNIIYSLRVHGVPMRWKTLITDWKDQESFVDIQRSGPYELWHHTHNFYEVPGGTLIHDKVRYRVPLGIPGFLFGMPLVKRDVNQIFNHRKKVIEEMFV